MTIPIEIPKGTVVVPEIPAESGIVLVQEVSRPINEEESGDVDSGEDVANEIKVEFVEDKEMSQAPVAPAPILLEKEAVISPQPIHAESMTVEKELASQEPSWHDEDKLSSSHSTEEARVSSSRLHTEEGETLPGETILKMGETTYGKN